MADASGTGGIAWKAALVAAGAAIALAPPAAALVAVIYRFPVPLSGYVSGFAGAGTAAVASLFYLVLGGAPLLGILAGAAGFAAARSAKGDTRRLWRRTFAAAACVALLSAVALAVLEFFIGPW
ncbi:hypothetical protein DFR70_101788 [Nocardia tenerifensis]|uniref:Uncharacterized protein n=1 Tax=Nocardia tenerifensis TaxID=228006 RepID=A0A318KB73_9NOCA|nr:hypothetical protein [Nocardia tenerifensis]PXX71366.1 hypothetical protein DFR70_101788 [Nocardia tenerifensis]